MERSKADDYLRFGHGAGGNINAGTQERTECSRELHRKSGGEIKLSKESSTCSADQEHGARGEAGRLEGARGDAKAEGGAARENVEELDLRSYGADWTGG